MSLLNTKPRWAPTAIATPRGWQDPVTNEVYIAISQLDKLLVLEAEKLAAKTAIKPVIIEPAVASIATEIVPAAPVPTTIIEEIKENIVTLSTTPTTQVEEVKVKRPYTKKVKVDEVVETPKSAQIIGEVVEHALDSKVIGE